MDRHGFIHDELEIKVLILFILRHLPEAVDANTLAELSLCDEGISYFDYCDCLANLVETGHVSQENNTYKITEKGERNGSTAEKCLPYSVRKNAESRLAKVAAGMRRNSMIKTRHSLDKEGVCTVELGLSDGCGEIIAMRMLVSGEEQARQMEENFRARAEQVYGQIVELLSMS